MSELELRTYVPFKMQGSRFLGDGEGPWVPAFDLGASVVRGAMGGLAQGAGWGVR
jgi:hypothetical protein